MLVALTVSPRRLVQKLSTAIIGVVCFAGVVSAQSAPAATTSPDGWEISVTPYVFLPRLKGTIGVVGETAEVNASFSDIFRNLDFAAMGPIVGARGTATLSPRTFVMGEFDAGGFGVGSDFTGQVFGGVGFN